MSELKNDLNSLKIDRDRPAARAWRWPLLLLAPVIVVLAVLYGLRVQQAMAAPEVETLQVSARAPTEASAGTPLLSASGYVVARRKAVVSAKIQGRLAELKVEEGSRVRENEVIARLEDTDYRASVARAEAEVQRAEAELAENQRQLRLAERLVAEKVLAEDQREVAVSRVRIAEAALSQARANVGFVEAQLQNTVIRAPFAGVVVKKMAEVGESVAPIPPGVNISTASGAIVALADLDTLEVEADIAESNVAKLSEGQPAEVAPEAFPERRYKAVLRQVIPTADRTKATVQVKVTILDKDKDLKPEMSARVTFLEKEQPKTASAAPEAPAIRIAREAIATRGGRSVVFEVVEGKLRERAITTGGEREGQVVVKQGLAGGETLVTRPAAGLKDGDAVRVKG